MDAFRTWLPLIIAALCNSSANVLLKIGAARDGTQPPKIFNLATTVAIFLFIGNLVSYRIALERMRVSLAFPLQVSASILMVTVAATLVPALNEKITAAQAGGMLLIGLGVWLLSSGSSV